MRRRWGPLVESYLRTSDELRGLVILVDARRGLSDADRRLVSFVADLELPVLLVLTKVDKLNRSERARAIAAVREELGLPEEQVLATSARTREGTEDLLESIDDLLGSDG